MNLPNYFQKFKEKKIYNESLIKNGYAFKIENDIVYTVGLVESKHIPNFEIKLSISESTKKDIIKYYIDMFASDPSILINGLCLNDIDNNCATWFYITSNQGEKRFRIILSDSNNLAPWDKKCDKLYKKQWSIQDAINNISSNQDMEEQYD